MNLPIVLYTTSLVLFVIGLYGLLARRNLIRMVIGLTIAELGVNLFLVTVGYVDGGVAPIFPGVTSRMVDPIPQALVLTAIVIGFGVTALALTMVMRIHASQGTVDTARMRGLKW
jgi:multicomponent Na+:H+ antiporter subunit C